MCAQNYDHINQVKLKGNNAIFEILRFYTLRFSACMGNLRPAGQIRPAKASHLARQ